MIQMTCKRNVFLLVVFAIFSFSLVAARLPEKPSCPDVIQQGQVAVTIPNYETSGIREIQITPCAGMNIQASGGPNDHEPVVINAIVHQDVLLLMVHR
ncbi:MAG: hypothetical protein GWN00_30890, partial [Aliifodinibius sp.]|nr:hypothetical protein [Fodinibius sp.]NIV15187.1 hypothetical protein [Fodinibius sp.]NIY29034.1 hypothetical protein [Fodinibius sp.]